MCSMIGYLIIFWTKIDKWWPVISYFYLFRAFDLWYQKLLIILSNFIVESFWTLWRIQINYVFLGFFLFFNLIFLFVKKIYSIRKLKSDFIFQPLTKTGNSFILLGEMESLKLIIKEKLKKMYKNSFIIFDEKILFLFFFLTRRLNFLL